ncbi:MAG: gliding motility-associated C-terminal domain-containing protein [Bacteroidota bacterium]|nr:gliding motility-associated C-terminal domain-containing protein [Bacteroidota bacterium]
MSKAKPHILYLVFLLLPVLAFSFVDTSGVSYLNYAQNKGQWNEKVLFKTNFRGGNLFLEKKAFTYLFYPKEGLEEFHHHALKLNKTKTFQAVKMSFENASEDAEITASEKQSHYENYFLGKDPTKWAKEVSLFKQVVYNNIYKGISIKTFGDENNVRFDFIVSPQSDPNLIQLKFTGQNKLFIKDGNLVLDTELGEIIQKAPIAYQVYGKTKKRVACSYYLVGNTLGFSIDDTYNKNLPLIIDPTLVFATFTGSTADNWGMTATYDNSGNAYTAGICFNTGYPTTTGAFQVSFGDGPGNNIFYAGVDISVSKFDASGTSLLYSSYLGGNDNEVPVSIVCDESQNLYILGRTYSIDFPVTAGVVDNTHNGGCDLIITKINPSGTALSASTFLGGSLDDGINIEAVEAILSSLKYNYADDGRGGILLDQNNNVYVSTCTFSTDFPVTPGCYQSSLSGMQDACAFKMNSDLSAVYFSTYIGGTGNDAAYNIALDSKDQLYVTGGTESADFPSTSGALHTSYSGAIDGFVLHLNTTGNSILQSSFIGTTSYDQCYFVQTDKDDNVYLYGQTQGAYPVSSGVYSNPNSGQFIHCLDSALAISKFSTVFGAGRSGLTDIVPSAFMVDNCQHIYISGWGGILGGYNGMTSTTTGLPVTADAFQASTDGSDFYFLVLNKDAQSLMYATFFGGPTIGEHVDGGTSRFDKSGAIYQAICGGCGAQSGMPTTPGVWSQTNNSNNCNNALVKFSFNMEITVAQLNMFPQNATGCVPFMVEFTNQSINSVQYEWVFGDGSGSSLTQPTHTYTTAGTYTIMLIAIDSSTCNIRDTAYANIVVMPDIALDPLPQMSVCSGDSIHLLANAPGASIFSWNPATYLNNPSVNNPSGLPLSDITYTLTASNGICSRSETADVFVNTNDLHILLDNSILCTNSIIPLLADTVYLSYDWSTGDILPQTNISQTGTYYLSTVDQNGCVGTDSVVVTGLAVDLDPMPPVIVCSGDSMHLQVLSSNAQSVNWDPTTYLDSVTVFNPVGVPLTNITYTVTGFNGSCSSSETVSVTLKTNQPEILIDLSQMCSSNPTTLSADTVYSDYLWSTGETGQQIVVSLQATYTLTTTDFNGCIGTDTASVTNFTAVPVMAYDTGMCVNQSVQLFNTEGNYVYNWAPSNSLSNPGIFNPIATPSVTTTYTLSITNGPCITTNTVIINILPLPVVNVEPASITIIPGETVEMVGIADTTCYWSPPRDLLCDACFANSATPDSNSVYYATVFNQYGCSSTDSIQVFLSPVIYIPNAFTPNTDITNAIFKPEHIGIVKLEVLIFDRWGELIYKIETLNGGWDGTYKGKNVQQDVYIYKLTATDYLDNVIEKAGTVTLIR